MTGYSSKLCVSWHWQKLLADISVAGSETENFTFSELFFSDFPILTDDGK